MPFLLTIRHGVDNARDHFAPGDVRRFDSLPIRIGADTSCACRIESEDVPPEIGALEMVGAQNQVLFTSASGVEVFVNDDLLSAPVYVRSGDEIRADHWLIRFHRLHDMAKRSRSANVLSVLAKVCVALLLVVEVSIVFWIPAQARRESLWAAQLARLRSARAMDHARNSVRNFKHPNPAVCAIATAVENELNARARYLRANRDAMTPEQHRTMTREIEQFSAIVSAAQRGKAFQAIPELRSAEAIERELGTTTKDPKEMGEPK